jgi:hypothetical protein
MANATTTTVGEIVLGGDLTGDANYPELRASGVTPGTYAPVKRLSVDSKGRITSIGQMTSPEVTVLALDATTSTKGIVQIGNGLVVSGGSLSLPTATASTKGIYTIGNGLVVSSGIVTIDFLSILSTGSTFGIVKTGAVGTNITNTAGVLSIPDATSSVKGVASFGSGLSVAGGAVSLVDATSVVKGVYYLGTGIDITAGVATIVTSPVATSTVFGFVKNGTNITNTAGVLSIPDATSSVKGVASFGGGLITSSGNVVLDMSTLPATSTVFGFVKNGTNITNTAGVLSIPDATSSVKGIASFDAASFNVVTGAASCNPTMITDTSLKATTTIFGAVTPQAPFVMTGNELSIPDATTTTKGIVSLSAGLTATAAEISFTDVARISTINTYALTQKSSVQGGGPTSAAAIIAAQGFGFLVAEINSEPVKIVNVDTTFGFNAPLVTPSANCTTVVQYIFVYPATGFGAITLSGTWNTNRTITFTNAANAIDVVTVISSRNGGTTKNYLLLNENFI